MLHTMCQTIWQHCPNPWITPTSDPTYTESPASTAELLTLITELETSLQHVHQMEAQILRAHQIISARKYQYTTPSLT